jgi:hypothetical protein
MTWNLGFGALCAGVAGALLFDIWNWLIEAVVGIRAPRWEILGRWLLVPFTTRDEPRPDFTPRERLLGTLAHYATGVAFAFALMLAMGPGWIAEPTVLPAVVAGIITTVFAWFVIMPALGAGIAGARIPHPNRHRVATLVAHVVMGLGFYVGAAAVAATASRGAA